MAEMTPQMAAQEVIKLKKQYASNSNIPNYNSSQEAKALSSKAETLRTQYGLDATKYGSGVGIADAYSNYDRDYGNVSAPKPTSVPMPNNSPPLPAYAQPTPYVPRGPSEQDQAILNLINSLPAQMLSYDDAKKRANDEMGYEYDKALDTSMKNIDRQSLQNGFFGQLPTLDYKQRNADDIERARASGISGYANQLVDSSKADVRGKIADLLGYNQLITGKENNEWEKAFKERGYIDSRSDIDWDKAFKDKSYRDSRSDVDWEKGFKERGYTDSRADAEFTKSINTAQLTGIFQGSPTMAYTQLAHSMGMDEKKMAMAEKELNHNIGMSYEKLKLDKIGLSQAGARIGIARQDQLTNDTKFMISVKEKAFDMTLKELDRTSKGSFTDDGLGFLYNDAGSGKPYANEGEIQNLMASYVDYLLGNVSDYPRMTLPKNNNNQMK